MLIDKEYPATHSMSTAWFAIDAEGNVAIIEFEDNGPVPTMVPESCEAEIIEEYFSKSDPDKPYLEWSFTKEEICNILASSRDYEFKPDDASFFDAAVKVDMTRFDEFLKAARVFEKSSTICIDMEDGLFFLDWFGYTKREADTVVNAVKSELVTPLKIIDLWNSDQGPDALANYPFYVYRQPYCPEMLIERTVAPEKPFREDRLPESARKRAIRLPFLFKDTPEFQIAAHEFSEDYFYQDDVLIDNHSYRLMPMPGGKKAYAANSAIYTAGCGLYCRKCFHKGEKFHPCYECQCSKHPTIAVITDIGDYGRYEHSIIGRDSVYLPIIQGVPASPEDWKDRKRYIENYPIEKMFFHCHRYLEKNIDFFKPRVVILFADVIRYLQGYYPMHDGLIKIGREEYPYFIWEDRDTHKAEIDSLASLPYRGGTIPMAIPEEEVPEGKALSLDQPFDW